MGGRGDGGSPVQRSSPTSPGKCTPAWGTSPLIVTFISIRLCRSYMLFPVSGLSVLQAVCSSTIPASPCASIISIIGSPFLQSERGAGSCEGGRHARVRAFPFGQRTGGALGQHCQKEKPWNRGGRARSPPASLGGGHQIIVIMVIIVITVTLIAPLTMGGGLPLPALPAPGRSPLYLLYCRTR